MHPYRLSFPISSFLLLLSLFSLSPSPILSLYSFSCSPSASFLFLHTFQPFLPCFLGRGRFMQISGLRFTWNDVNPAYSRIVSVDVFNKTTNSYQEIGPDTWYTLTISNYILGGGDGYIMCLNRARWVPIQNDATDMRQELAIIKYLTQLGSFAVKTEGRITRSSTRFPPLITRVEPSVSCCVFCLLCVVT